MLTASGLERATACPPSVALPQVLDTNEDAERGICIHGYCKRHIHGVAPEAALALVPLEWRATCANIDFKRVLGGMRDVRAEVAYAIDVASDAAAEIGVDIDRRYPAAPPEVLFGTIDVEGIGFDDVPTVDDWKTGFKSVTPCRENMQMMFAARARQLLTGADRVRARILYIRETGAVDADTHVFTRYDLDAFVDVCADVVRRVLDVRAMLAAGGRPTVSSGEWCGYCGAMPCCPAYTALARSMLPELTELEDQIATLTPAQGGAAWMRAKEIARLAERVVDGLKELAKRHPMPSRPGKEIRPIGVSKTYFKKERAIHLLLAKGASREEIASCEERVVEVQIREVNAR